MKIEYDHVLGRELILMMIGILDHDLNRMYMEAQQFTEQDDDSLDQLHTDIIRFRENLMSVGQSILKLIHEPGMDAGELFRIKHNVVNDLERIKAKLEGLGGMLDKRSHLYN